MTWILQAHARKVPISHDVDFDHLADATGGLSGANLQALLYNAHLEVVHESIQVGGGHQISVSTCSEGSSSKIHRVDNTTAIDHTSFGGPAPAQSNNAVKSHAEQMIVHRRVRINPAPFFFLTFWFKCFFGSCARWWLLHSVVVVREQNRRTSWRSRILQRYVFQ